MIGVKGSYQLIKNKGLEVYDTNNILVKRYFSVDAPKPITLNIGSNGVEPNVDEVVQALNVYKVSANGLDGNSVEITNDSFKINMFHNFDIGSGYDFIARDISCGYTNSNYPTSINLYSRALFRDSDGVPEDIVVTNKDYLEARYILTYNIPRAPLPVTVTIKGEQKTGNIQFVNPNKWGTDTISVPVEVDGLAIAPAGTWTPDSLGYVSTGYGTGTIPLTTKKFFSDSTKTFRFEGSAETNELNGTFRQIGFYKTAHSPNNLVAILTFDEDVVNTSDDYLALGIDIIQRITI